MKKLIILFCLLFLVGCNKTEDKSTIVSKEIVSIDDYKVMLNNAIVKYNLNTDDLYKDAVISVMNTYSSGEYVGDNYVISINLITEDSLIEVIDSDPYFKSTLLESIDKGTAEKTILDYLVSLYPTSIEKESNEYLVTPSQVEKNELGFLVELYNKYFVSLVNGVIENYVISIKEDVLGSMTTVKVGKSIPVDYYDKDSLLVSITEVLSGDDAIDYLSSLSSINSLQTVSPNTEVKVIKYTVQNLLKETINFESPILMTTNDLQVFNPNTVYSGEITTGKIKGYSNKDFMSILIGQKDNNIVLWHDYLTKQTFKIE